MTCRTALVSLAGALLAAGLLLAARSTPVHGQETGDPDRGRQVFEANCAMCHGSDAAGMMGVHPSLRGAIARLGREGVEVTIRTGRATRPPMPSFGDRLSGDEIADVIAYLETLPVGPRNFGPELSPGGMQGRMSPADDGSDVLPWVLVALLAALLAGVGGYLLGSRRTRHRSTSLISG